MQKPASNAGSRENRPSLRGAKKSVFQAGYLVFENELCFPSLVPPSIQIPGVYM